MDAARHQPNLWTKRYVTASISTRARRGAGIPSVQKCGGTVWNRAPDFITLSIGEQDTPIVDEITTCFNNVKSHDFASALNCATNIQSNTAAFTTLNNNLITTSANK